MLFNSFAFAVFLPIVFLLYWALPHKFRWPLLLIASYYFYMSWEPKYVVLILFTTFISYLAGIMMEKSKTQKQKKVWLVITLLASLGVLFFFKYFNFFTQTVTDILKLFTIKFSPLTLKILLPVGISFYTFQTLAYVIDVYRGDVKAEHNFGIYATFISFFPQLVAGPIERTSNLLPQITSEKKFSYDNCAYGLRVMAWGFFKKIAVADVLAVYVEDVFGRMHDPVTAATVSGIDAIAAVLLFSIQVYCDFSGYSDIALGSAKLLGIDLMVNFKSPYFSSSVKQFWSRWHISLSTWFKDYVYFPLGGSRCSKARNYFNLFITLVISSIWHGAKWTFAVWGACNGVAQVTEKALSKPLDKFRKKNAVTKWVCIICTYLVCALPQVFFRADTFGNAITMIKHMFSFGSPDYFNMTMNIGAVPMLKAAFSIILLAVFDYFAQKHDIFKWVGERKLVARWAIYIAMVFIIIINSAAATHGAFVYFQF